MEAQTELRLPAEPAAPGLARARLDAMLSGLSDRARANLALLTTEVVANAVKHSGTGPGEEITVRVEVHDLIRVEVTDPGGPFPPLRSSRPAEPTGSGWGLYLLDHLAVEWGVVAEGNGKTVWFELDPRAR